MGCKSFHRPDVVYHPLPGTLCSWRLWREFYSGLCYRTDCLELSFLSRISLMVRMTPMFFVNKSAKSASSAFGFWVCTVENSGLSIALLYTSGYVAARRLEAEEALFWRRRLLWALPSQRHPCHSSKTGSDSSTVIACFVANLFLFKGVQRFSRSPV